MKKQIQKFISSVAVLVLTVLSVQFAQAGEVALKVMDTTAGQPAMIMATGEANSVIDLTITNPYNSTIIQKYQLNDQGVLQLWYKGAVIAGQYQVNYEHLSATFYVTAGLPDPGKSKIVFEDYTAYVGEKIQGQIVLKDYYANLITGEALDLSMKGMAQISCTNNCKTNQAGVMNFAILSNQPGLVKLTVSLKDPNLIIFQEDIGFIPYVQRSIPSYSGYSNNLFYDFSPIESFNPGLDYIPIFDPSSARTDARGGEDFLNTNFSYDPIDFLTADLLSPGSGEQLAQGPAPDKSFEIIIGTDPEADFKSEVVMAAQTAQDFIIRAVDKDGNVITDYTGDIEFDINPSGPLVPGDYSFTALDQGVASFELALVLSTGDFTVIVTDKADPTMKGEINITAEIGGAPGLNATNITLIINSPIANSVYSDNLVVQGSTNTDNTEISIKEGSLQISKVDVDENKQFNIPLDLDDGMHVLEITASYLVDGSFTSTSVAIEVDKTPPVIVEIDADIEVTRAGETFSMTAEAEADSILKAFINNRSYEFTGVGTSYTLTANAPLEAGSYTINIQISDEHGNSETIQDVGTLTVTEALQEIQNLFGIPGIGTATLSWSPVVGASSYEVAYKSILEEQAKVLTTNESRITVKDLAPDLSYLFTITAKDVLGVSISISTDSRSIKVLAAPVEEEPAPKPAADIEPDKTPSTGPEVYVLILASLIILNIYGRIRRSFASCR